MADEATYSFDVTYTKEYRVKAKTYAEANAMVDEMMKTDGIKQSDVESVDWVRFPNDYYIKTQFGSYLKYTRHPQTIKLTQKRSEAYVAHKYLTAEKKLKQVEEYLGELQIVLEE